MNALVKCLVLLHQERRDQFAAVAITLFHQVVFPLLRIKDDELRLFDEDP